jgi:homopolymeric O-antigen transport system permease protein
MTRHAKPPLVDMPAASRITVPASTTRLVIEPGMAAKTYWRDLWHYRELMYFLAWRDIAVRYKQTVIGVAWALLRPALTMLVFVAFRRLVGLPSGEVPEPILVFAAVLPWQFFSGALAEAAGSLIGNANLIRKIYFPRLLIPFAAVVTSLADFAITLGLLAALMIWYGFAPGWQIVTLPLFVLLAFGLALGFGLLLAALNVEYRDFRYVVPFIVQFGVFVSPIAFSTADVPEKWRTLYALNPLVGVIDGFRWSVLGGRVPLDGVALGLSAVVTLSMTGIGLWYFRRMEHGFADVI